MGQSMHGWKADDFFFSVRQHPDSLGPRGLEDLRLALTKAATNIAPVSKRLNNEHLGRILENAQATTKKPSATRRQSFPRGFRICSAYEQCRDTQVDRARCQSSSRHAQS
jgi:hypothetical protein